MMLRPDLKKGMMTEFNEVSRQNNETFDAGELARLGIYVYVLQDPANQRFLDK
jgi:hypothetical protein